MSKRRNKPAAKSRHKGAHGGKQPAKRSGPRAALEKSAGRIAGASTSTYALVALVVILTAVKMLVVSYQGMTALGGAEIDDSLFVRSAFYLGRGLWLGPYDWLTLSKGPGYPLWIAAVAALRMPLLFAQQVLYAFACAVLTIVMRPVLRSRGALVALYIVLLLNPIAFADGTATRVLREGIYHSLTMLVVACAIAVWVRADRVPRRWLGWAVGLGVSGAAFWLTREEGVWLAPILLLPVATVATVVRSHGWSRERISASLRPWALGAAVALLLVGAVAANNQRVYGVFQTADTMSGSFVRAYGALARVESQNWERDIPVPRDVRLRVYAVSPAFARLAPSLEGTVSATWTSFGRGSDIQGGWFMWALRDAVRRAGYYSDPQQSARPSEEFYQQIADEVNAACASGRLAAGPPRASLMPPLRREYIDPILSALTRSARVLALFEGISPRSSPSEIPPYVEEGFTRTVLGPYAGLDPEPAGRETATAVLDAILAAYQGLMPIALLLAIPGAILTLADLVRRKADGRTVATSIILAVVALLIIARMAFVALVDATSFPAADARLLSPAHGLIILWAFLSVALLVGRVRRWRASRSAR